LVGAARAPMTSKDQIDTMFGKVEKLAQWKELVNITRKSSGAPDVATSLKMSDLADWIQIRTHGEVKTEDVHQMLRTQLGKVDLVHPTSGPGVSVEDADNTLKKMFKDLDIDLKGFDAAATGNMELLANYMDALKSGKTSDIRDVEIALTKAGLDPKAREDLKAKSAKDTVVTGSGIGARTVNAPGREGLGEAFKTSLEARTTEASKKTRGVMRDIGISILEKSTEKGEVTDAVRKKAEGILESEGMAGLLLSSDKDMKKVQGLMASQGGVATEFAIAKMDNEKLIKMTGQQFAKKFHGLVGSEAYEAMRGEIQQDSSFGTPEEKAREIKRRVIEAVEMKRARGQEAVQEAKEKDGKMMSELTLLISTLNQRLKN